MKVREQIVYKFKGEYSRYSIKFCLIMLHNDTQARVMAAGEILPAQILIFSHGFKF